jgi:hypothetical protein
MTNLEQIAAGSIGAGVAGLLAAAVWIWIAAWRVSWKWGLGLTLFAPAVVVFIRLYFHRLKRPLTLLLLSAFLVGVPFGVNAVVQRIDLGPREKIVDGEKHITLTGWDQGDYSILKSRPDVVVLQIANPEVTDATLEYLRGMARLRELDLNDTQITDQGLSVLKDLPALARLRLRATRITDEGFQRELAGKETLLEVDVRETPVASSTLREWKKAKDGRKYLK